MTRLRKECYGLVEAPLEWYRTIAQFLESLGLERTWADACTWAYRREGELKGLISGHVDDFLFAGSQEDKQWQEVLQAIRQRFKWGDWESQKFTQCGVVIETTNEGFALSQPHYLDGVNEIQVCASRRRDPGTETSDKEKSQLRTMLGALSWHAQQVAPHVSADVSLLLSEVNHSTIATIKKANTLLQHTKARSNHVMLIHKFGAEEEVGLFCWVDAASQNRLHGGSTQGILVGMGPKTMLSGEVGRVTPISWQSSRIDRVCAG